MLYPLVLFCGACGLSLLFGAMLGFWCCAASCCAVSLCVGVCCVSQFGVVLCLVVVRRVVVPLPRRMPCAVFCPAALRRVRALPVAPGACWFCPPPPRWLWSFVLCGVCVLSCGAVVCIVACFVFCLVLCGVFVLGWGSWAVLSGAPLSSVSLCCFCCAPLS